MSAPHIILASLSSFSQNHPNWWTFEEVLTKTILHSFLRHGVDPRFVCKLREIWLTGNRWDRALLTSRKKNKTSARASVLAAARIAPKVCQGQLQAMYSERPKFNPNPFTSSGVIAERVNVVETRHKVFPILGEATAPSPNNNHNHNLQFVFKHHRPIH